MLLCRFMFSGNLINFKQINTDQPKSTKINQDQPRSTKIRQTTQVTQITQNTWITRIAQINPHHPDLTDHTSGITLAHLWAGSQTCFLPFSMIFLWV